jgi:ribonucleoside-diphosphate reductase alpha chain
MAKLVKQISTDKVKEVEINVDYINALVDEMIEGLNLQEPNVKEYRERIEQSILSKETVQEETIENVMILKALDNIGTDMMNVDPDWTFVAQRVFKKSLYRKASLNRGYDADQKYGDFYGLVKQLTNIGIYNKNLLESYSKEEIKELGKDIVAERDNKFNYIGFKLLADRYLATDHAHNNYELPQERFMIIAMALMINEPKEKRVELIKEAYWALSNLYMTVATPTLSNAGKSYGQYSSCFIDTVDDSLDGIFMNNWDIARLSKDGGGIGIYLGKVRAKGSDIKGFKGVASGVMGWMKQLNNTAVSVDQLGQRQGSIAVYLDIFHKDIDNFLDARLNNGDERMRTHDLSLGVTIPDVFMEAVKNREDFHTFDPYEVEKVMGFRLEDSYDEKRGEGTFRERYLACVNNPILSRKTVPAIDLMKKILKSQKETGYPFMFYRDEANRMNANKAHGMVYSSNLCTEIIQNMSATTIKREYVTEEGTIVIERQQGDFVVCNLSSINLHNAVMGDVLERLIPVQVRMLDNVIDLNNITVMQAQMTNKKYRAVGLGTFGIAHLLAVKGIKWESDEAVKFNDELYEKIAYLTIKASKDLAIEKGSYPAYEGSDWSNGNYFDIRGYEDEKWTALKKEVMENGMRNGYLMAIAPNASTAKIGGSTDGIDGIFKKIYAEEKKDSKIPVTVPDLNAKTNWFYKSAYETDQTWSIKQNAMRQKHIDQSISFNFYVFKDVKASKLLELHLLAWELGMKSSYYMRSTSLDIDFCESCAS